MKNNTYKRLITVLVLLFAGVVPGFSQQSSSSSKATVKVPSAKAAADSDEYKQLRKKQLDLSKELREVNAKLAEQNRRTALLRYKTDSTRLRNSFQVFRTDSLYKALEFRGAIRGFYVDSLTSRLHNQTGSVLAIVGSSRKAAGLDSVIITRGRALNDKIRSRTFTTPLRINGQEYMTIPGTASGSDNYKGMVKSKSVSKSFSVKADDKVIVNNQYGKVQVVTWNKNEVKVDVEIKAFHDSDASAQELLDGVTVTDSKQNHIISFKTNIVRKKNDNWWGIRKSNGVEERRGVQVNYTIYMPAKGNLDVINQFGSITLPDLQGVVMVNLTNGNLTAQRLTNPANRIVVDQGTATITTFTSGNIKLSYGNLVITNASKVNAKVMAGVTSIGTLDNGGNLDVTLGGFKVNELSRNIKDLIINADKSSVSLGIDPSSNFNFDVTVNQAGFRYDADKVNLQKTLDGNAKSLTLTRNYVGQYGKGSAARVIIKSNYGPVQFL